MKGRITRLLAAVLWPGALVSSYASTDSTQDADPSQSGYLPNHNMDPNVVGSPSFGILWQQTMPNDKETWFAKPLTYTLNGGTEMVITASNLNNVRIHDAKTGNLIASRQLMPPFLQSDIGCADIPNYIGVTGTPVIDPATDIVYMFAKGYRGGAAGGGVAKGIYQMYALKLPTLADAPGFPVLMDGNRADNDPTRYFVGGTVLQRPALATLNGAILVAFGGHCDLFNYTGFVAAVSKTPGDGVVGLFAMESSPGAPIPQQLDITKESGGKAGIWQSGMGIAVDGSRAFVVTGNGQGHANGNVPAGGRLPLSTLDECVVNLGVSAAGKFSLTDYFEPYDYVNMDAADQDLGSSGLCLLDKATFKAGTVNRIGVTVGKNSKVYIMNADNLGGFKQGPGGTDGVIQTITSSNSVFGGVGSYPLEGGYFYFTPVGDATYAYKFGTDSSGAPFFTLAGKTPWQSAGRVGVGQPTVTTNKGQAGSAILWIADVNTGLQAFKAVPDSNGLLQPINLPALPGINKFQRPAFGDGRLFVTAENKIFGLGSPVNLPLKCTDPVNFGTVETDSSGTTTVSCTANIAITKINGATTADPRFKVTNSSLPTGAVAAGATFSFPVTWDITEKSLAPIENTSYGKVIPGPEGTVLNILTTNGPGGYTNAVPISLSGTIVSKTPFLFISPGQVDFGGLVLGTDQSALGLTASATIQNVGNSPLTILGMAWSAGGQYTNVTFAGGKATFGQGFAATSFPTPGSKLADGQTLGIPLSFSATTAGSRSVTLTVWSDGGIDTLLLSASAGNAPIASIAVSTSEGGWDTSTPVKLDFGDVLGGKTVTRKIRICNSGGSVLTITKSKPPMSPQLTATDPYGELLEGQKIAVGDCAYGAVAVYAGTVQPNHPAQRISLVWVLNTDGRDALKPTQEFGVREIASTVSIVSRQVGPLLANGQARFQWVGCFRDNNGRNLATQINSNAQEATNTNGQCQKLCSDAGYSLAGTEYHQECWCSNDVKYPESYTTDAMNYCTFSCTGDETESCGGDGGYLSLYADTTKFDIQKFWNSIPGAPKPITSSSSTSVPTTTTTTTTTTSRSSTSTSTTTAVSTTSSIRSTTSSTTSTSSTRATTSATSTTSSSTSSAPATTSSTSHLNPSQPALVSGQWDYIGCFLDNVNGVRSLSVANTAADTMTLESCAAFCSKYNFFGVEWSRECYCGNTLATATLKAPELDCDFSCQGNVKQLCGAGSRLSVFSNRVNAAPPAQPSHVAQAGNYAWAGCYSEASAGRALSLAATASDDMTVEVCAKFCAEKGAQKMGVEYGRECYCGNGLGGGSTLQKPEDCSMLCKGDASGLSFCGNGGKLDLYTFAPPGAGPTTVSASPSSTRSSSSSTSTSRSSTTTTTTSSSRSTTSTTTTSSSRTSTSSTSTSRTSTSTSTPVTSSRSSSTATIATTSRSSTTTSGPPGPTATNGYYLIGCFADTSDGHALPGLVANDSMTPELCIAHANSVYSSAPQPTPAARLQYLAIEYHHECYGGKSLDFMGSAVTSLVGTNACQDYCFGSVRTFTTNGAAMTTTGTENMCGGAKQFNLYALSTPAALPTTGGKAVTVTAN
ncbi:WSC domain-containing protein [Apodospora peruviana]|uniref:WSC domain-containing protein n=1 Tax=Apodospora peruviana TaxID=516989 RepID=A0AAE0IS21_9PEZI|nr:WSC domain-containing protein [Apodospora peruviana]